MKTLPKCPVEITLALISNKWSILIIRDLLTGTKRFNELKRSVGDITQKVLTSNLRTLEENGIVDRVIYPVVPPKVEYNLTELGMSLEPVIQSMRDWGIKYTEMKK